MKRQKIPKHGNKWSNQKGLKGLQPLFAKSIRNSTPNLRVCITQQIQSPLPRQNLVARLMANLRSSTLVPKPMKIMKVLPFFSFSWSTSGFRLLPKVVKLLKKMYVNLVPSVLIESNTTPPVCSASERIILFCTLSSIN